MPSHVPSPLFRFIRFPSRLRQVPRLLLLLGALFAMAGSAAARVAPFQPDVGRGSGEAAAATSEFDKSGTATGAVDEARGPQAAGATSATDPLFFKSVSYETGQGARNVTVADANRDGILDLFVANWFSGTTRVMLGVGDGTFDYGVTIPTGPNTSHAVMADFAGTGRPLLAVAKYIATDSIDVFATEGHFYSPVTRLGASGTGNRCLAAADFNGDGLMDLAAVSEQCSSPCPPGEGGYGRVTVWLGTFGPPWLTKAGSFSTGAGISDWIVTGDFNEDGRADVATTSDYPYSRISVLFGNGDGTFAPAITFPTGTGPNTLTTGDFNGDHHLDLASANWIDIPSPTGTVSVFLGDGHGSFQTMPTIPLGTPVGMTIASAEMTGDSATDLVVTHQNGSLSIFRGNGDGTFTPYGLYSVGRNNFGLALADFDGDGRTDISETNYYANTVSVLVAEGAGKYPGQVYPVQGKGLPIAAGDFNGDGRADVAAPQAGSNSVSVLFAAAGGNLLAPVDYPVGTGPVSVCSADFNRDGMMDLAAANNGNGTVTVLYGSSKDTFKSKANFGVAPGPAYITTGDVNSDGLPDLLTCNPNDQSVSVLLKQKGGQGFKDRINTQYFLQPIRVAVGDLNHDLRPDLIVLFQNNSQFAYQLGNGDGTFGPPVFRSWFGIPVSVAVTDVNSDGLPDVCVAVNQSDFYYVQVWVNSYYSGISPWNYWFIRHGPTEIVPSDLDGNGSPEIVAASADGHVNVLNVVGAYCPRFTCNWLYGGRSKYVALGDVNGDGRMDVVTSNASPDIAGITVLLNATGGSTSLAGNLGGSRGGSESVAGHVSLSPDPLNPQATLKFAVLRPGPLRVRVFDVQGRLVKTLLDESHASPGERTVRVDGADHRGARLGSGVYFFRIETGGGVASGRFVVLK